MTIFWDHVHTLHLAFKKFSDLRFQIKLIYVVFDEPVTVSMVKV